MSTQADKGHTRLRKLAKGLCLILSLVSFLWPLARLVFPELTVQMLGIGRSSLGSAPIEWPDRAVVPLASLPLSIAIALCFWFLYGYFRVSLIEGTISPRAAIHVGRSGWMMVAASPLIIVGRLAMVLLDIKFRQGTVALSASTCLLAAFMLGIGLILLAFAESISIASDIKKENEGFV